MTERKTIEIGSYRYVMRHAHASVALRAAATLANGLSPLINGFRRGRGGEIDKVLLGVAEAFADPALAQNVEALCKLFAPYTQVVWTSDGVEHSGDLGGDRGIFEEHFAGRFDSLLKWLQAAVEYDLGGFLADAKAKLAKARADAAASNAAAPESPSPLAAVKTG